MEGGCDKRRFHMHDIKFSQKYRLRQNIYGTWHCINWQAVTSVLMTVASPSTGSSCLVPFDCPSCRWRHYKRSKCQPSLAQPQNITSQKTAVCMFCILIPNSSPIDFLLSLKGQYQLTILINDINMATVVVIRDALQSFRLVRQHTVQLDTLLSATIKFQLRCF